MNSMKRVGQNKVYIATSLDGFIADANGKIDFLDTFPFPENDDMGYYQFMNHVDAILMGRKSFETVLAFGIDWPYRKLVFVWSQTLRTIPDNLEGKVKLISGDVNEVLDHIHQDGYLSLYIDGGKTIQSLLKEDLIDEMIITTISVLLGGGVPLFGGLDSIVKFSCVDAKVYANGVVQCRYISLVV